MWQKVQLNNYIYDEHWQIFIDFDKIPIFSIQAWQNFLMLLTQNIYCGD